MNLYTSWLQDYLAQLGIEEYLLESPERTNPGKYYDNVPLEDNPEAYLGECAMVDYKMVPRIGLGYP